MSMIKETFALVGDNADILAAPSRLAAMPADGVLTLEVSITHNDATNFGTITLQMPDGENPFTDLLIPFNGYSDTDGVIHDQTALQFSMQVEQGGHVLISYDETGTVVQATFLFTYTF